MYVRMYAFVKILLIVHDFFTLGKVKKQNFNWSTSKMEATMMLVTIFSAPTNKTKQKLSALARPSTIELRLLPSF